MFENTNESPIGECQMDYFRKQREEEQSRGYNGYPNWETWNVVLWIDNEEYSHNTKLALFDRYFEKVESFSAKDARAIAFACLGGRNTPDFDDREGWDTDEWERVDWEFLAKRWTEEARERLEES